MKQKNGRLIVLVAAIAVLAVVTGGVIASQRGPRNGANSAAPLAGQTTTPVAKTPTATPSTPTPSATPSNAGGPVKRDLTLSKLPRGRDPQMAYLVGREVRGGAGGPVTIPGTAQIQEIARLADSVLAIVVKGNGTELLTVNPGGRRSSTPDVTTMVTTADGAQAAYATTSPARAANRWPAARSTHGRQRRHRDAEALLPKPWEVRVIAYQDGKVYYRSMDTQNSNTWQLYAWDPAETPATVETITSPTALSGNGEVAAS